MLNYALNGMDIPAAPSGSSPTTTKMVPATEAAPTISCSSSQVHIRLLMERPGVNALRVPVFPQMEQSSSTKSLWSFLHTASTAKTLHRDSRRTHSRTRGAFTRSMPVWWAFQNPKQSTMSSTTLEIEHIYAKKRTETAP